MLEYTWNRIKTPLNQTVGMYNIVHGTIQTRKRVDSESTQLHEVNQIQSGFLGCGRRLFIIYFLVDVSYQNELQGAS